MCLSALMLGLMTTSVLTTGVYLATKYRVGVIVGNSMKPTLTNDKYVIQKKLTKQERENLTTGRVYVIKSPNGGYAVKRLHHSTNKCHFFLGDNLSESYDSRDYGYIVEDDIIAEVMWQQL